MLINNVHVVDDEKAMIRNIGPSTVRLRLFDHSQDISIRDSFYFSLVSLNFLFVRGLHFKDRKFDRSRFSSRCVVGEVPNDVVQTRAQVVDNFASEDSKTQGNHFGFVILRRFLKSLVLRMGDYWVLP